MGFSVVILAAGQGMRMRSSLPKVLHPIGGSPILKRIISTVNTLAPKRVIAVLGHQIELVKETLKNEPHLMFAEQREQLGTGHAVMQALPELGTSEKVLILCGDVPLISAATLKKLIEKTKNHALGFVTVKTSNPYGLGRVIRNQKEEVIDIIEEKDASDEEKQIPEINSGIYLVAKNKLSEWLPKLTRSNAQGEYYLTEVVKMAVKEKERIVTVSPEYEYEVLGVNDKVQLAALERIFQQEQATKLLQQGVTLLDPARFDLRGEVTVGEDVIIDVNVVLEGKNKIGNKVSIGPNVIIKHSEIHDGAVILANSVIEGAVIGPGASVGPFARVRPGTELMVNARVGNFVEIKNSRVGASSKINHLSYVGDAILGNSVNIGAGTITCNYDGKNKHQTIIGDRVMVGSDTQLIAPVRVGHGATIGAGTTVVRDVEPNELVHNRIEQRSVKNWAGRED